MLEVAAFFAGFTTGWAVRATANSSRALVVGLIAQVHGAADRVRTLTAIEREAIEDLLAEGKAVYEAGRRRSKRSAEAAARQAKGPEANGHEASHLAKSPEAGKVKGHGAGHSTNGHEANGHEVHGHETNGAGPASDHAGGRPADKGRARGAGSPS